MPKLGGIQSPRHRFMKYARPFPVSQEEDDTTSIGPASTTTQRSDIPEDFLEDFLVNVSVDEVEGDGSGDADLIDEYGEGDQLNRDQTERLGKLLQDFGGSGIGSGD